MNNYLFLTITILLQLLCLAYSCWRCRHVESRSDYYLAGQNVSFFPLMMTFIATQLGGGLILGAAEEAYSYGWQVIFYPMGAITGLILLGSGVGRKLSSFGVETVAALFEKAYSSPTLRKLASILSIFSLFLILVAQILASHAFAISLGIYHPLWFITCWMIVFAYTILGGLKAVIYTDVIQASFFILIFLATLIGAFAFPAHPLAPPLTSVPHPPVDITQVSNWFWMPLLFMLIEQDMGQRCFSAGSSKILTRATLTAACMILAVSAIPIYFGIAAQADGLDIPPGGSVLITAVTYYTNPLLTALFASALLAAIISTADSLINALSSNLAQDFGKKGATSDTPGRYRLFSAGIALCALSTSFYFSGIVSLLIYSYALCVSCLLVPIVAALIRPKWNSFPAYAAIGCGAACFGFASWLGIPWAPFAALVASLFGFCIGCAPQTQKSLAFVSSLWQTLRSWKSGRVAECVCLENRFTSNGDEGSNPSSSDP